MGPWSIPLLTARAKGVTEWPRVACLVCFRQRERKRERDQRVGYVCAWPERALSLFPAKVPGPAGRPPWTGAPVARPLPAMFVLEASKGARARPSLPFLHSCIHHARHHLSISILQRVRWIARHCRWDLRIHGFGRSKVRTTQEDARGWRPGP